MGRALEQLFRTLPCTMKTAWQHLKFALLHSKAAWKAAGSELCKSLNRTPSISGHLTKSDKMCTSSKLRCDRFSAAAGTCAKICVKGQLGERCHFLQILFYLSVTSPAISKVHAEKPKLGCWRSLQASASACPAIMIGILSASLSLYELKWREGTA